MSEDNPETLPDVSGEGQPPSQETISRRDLFTDPGGWFEPLVKGLRTGFGDESGGGASRDLSPPPPPEEPIIAPRVGRQLETPEEAKMREELQGQEGGLTRRQMLRNSGVLGTALVLTAYLSDFRWHWIDRFFSWRWSRQERERRPNQVVRAWAGLLLDQEGLERGALASLRTFAGKYHELPGGIDRYEIWEKSGLWGIFRMPLREEMAAVEKGLFQPLLKGDKSPILASWDYRQIASRKEVEKAVGNLFSFLNALPGEPRSADIFAYLVTVKGYDPAKVMAVRLGVEKYETKGRSETGRLLDACKYLALLEEKIGQVGEVLSAESEGAEAGIKSYLKKKGYSADEVEIVYQAVAIMRNRERDLSLVTGGLATLASDCAARGSKEALSFEELSKFLTARGYSAAETKKLRLAFAVLTETVSLEELLLSLS